MPIRLVTGLPGAGKTLSAVEWLLQRQDEARKGGGDGRPVFAWGIDSLREDVAEVVDDARVMKWRDFPPGSIVLVDEAQKLMPARRAGDAPDWIRDLSEHRHHGVDFVLVTQHPSLIDSYVRKLVDQHWHLVRQYGTHAFVRWEWSIVQADPNSRSARRSADRRTLQRYSKAAMSAYKSAEVHTVKRRLPRWVYVAAAALVGVPLVSYVAINVMERVTGNLGSSAPSKSVTSGVPAGLLGGRRSTGGRSVASPEQYMAARVPRIPSMPWSAPVYDDLPLTTVPDLRCISVSAADGSAVRCHCYSEQGTPVVGIPVKVCLGFALNGVYNPYRPVTMSSGNLEGPAPSSPVFQGSAVPSAKQTPLPSLETRADPAPSSGLRGHYVPPASG